MSWNTMEDRVTRLEHYCSACPIRLVDVERHRDDLGDVKERLARMDERLESIDHWIHNGGNTMRTEGRLRALENWRAFLLGAGALAGIMATTAIAWLAR